MRKTHLDRGNKNTLIRTFASFEINISEGVSKKVSSVPRQIRLLFSKAFWEENQVTAHVSNIQRSQKEGAYSQGCARMDSTNASADRLLLSDYISAKIYPKGCKYDRMAHRKLIFLGISCRKKIHKLWTPAAVSEDSGDTAGTVEAAKHPPCSGSRERVLSSSPPRNIPPPPLPSGDILAGFWGFPSFVESSKGDIESWSPAFPSIGEVSDIH